MLHHFLYQEGNDIIVNMLKKIIASIIYNLPIVSKKIILLESSPDYSDNTLYVYKELIKRKINQNYKIVWSIFDASKSYPKEKNVKFIKRQSLRGKWYNCRAKAIVDSNLFIKKVNKNQYRIHLTHGACIKRTYDYCAECGKFDNIIMLSDYFLESHHDQFGGDKQSYISTGFPRNDILLSKRKISELEHIKEKIIIWMPTYRNHHSKNGIQTNIHFKYGVPCIDSEKQLNELNDRLAKNHIRLIIRLHPAEDRTQIKALHMSNIKLYEESELGKCGEQLYDVLRYTDALITDYSSIYYDYLLLRKPIGLAIPDEKEFTNNLELAEKNYRDFIKGNYIVKFEELVNFVENVAKNIDPASKEEAWAYKRYHKYHDDKSSERVVDLIMKEISE